ncbi:DUF4303 domain-containing protein [Hymenobacter setariae]|nr:DUF4303 domain-containing protein [Hymenobacter setariae]
MAFDFQNFAQQLTQATQAAFTELLARYPEEAFYSFALYSDEGAMTVCPAANTLGHLAAQSPDDLPYAKFEPAEWQYEMVGADAQFDALSRQLRTRLAEGFAEPDGFERFRQQLYATCLEVLDALRQQRFFDKAAGRPVFLLVTISDSDTPPEELAQLASRLNNNAYRDEYLAWLRTWDA